mgnify:FL=1
MLRTAPEQIILDTPPKTIAFERLKADNRLVFAANFDMKPAGMTLPNPSLQAEFSQGEVAVDGRDLTLGPLAVAALG